jgi:uncharacterized membrane protein
MFSEYICCVNRVSMYQALLFSHSIIRWLVLASLLLAIYKSYKGFVSKSAFTKADNSIRHWTATIAHIQLVVGIILYTQSPVVKYFWANRTEATHHIDILFFGLLHMLLMLTAIVCITIGSSLAKRKQQDSAKYKTMLLWFSAALLIIFVAIPWPFSPLANRPYFR